jgi:D-serine deaminase-like pyridoxal phosphate-dependent protein
VIAPTEAVETPALVVDLDRLLGNIDRMAEVARSRGLALRPHAKTHKCPQIADLQRQAGAAGLTVATLSEAEVFAAAGFTDLLIAYPVFPGGAKADRLRRLLDVAELHVGVDNAAGAAAVATAAGGRTVRVLLEVDSGQHRTGVAASDAVALAQACGSLGLEVHGVFTHGGHSYAGPDAPAGAAVDEGAALAEAHSSLLAAGFDVSVVSAGSTPTAGAQRPAQVTEERPGSYVFHDRQQLALGACTRDQVALSVAATVVSVGHGRFVIDAGSKALASDRPPWLRGHGAVAALGDGPGLGDALVVTLSEHHGIVEGASRLPAVGDQVLVTPNHVCTVVNLFDEYVVTRAGTVVDRWPVAGRGRNL